MQHCVKSLAGQNSNRCGSIDNIGKPKPHLLSIVENGKALGFQSDIS